jgi:hypothetical protein
MLAIRFPRVHRVPPFCQNGVVRTGGRHHEGRLGRRPDRAMVIVHWACRKGAQEGTWLHRMLGRKPRMLVAIAIANKMAVQSRPWRPALDDKDKCVELTVRLRKQRRRKSELVDRLAGTPNRGVVRRPAAIRRNAGTTVSPEPPPPRPDQTTCATAAEAGS